VSAIFFIETFFTDFLEDTFFDLAQNLILLSYQHFLKNLLLVIKTKVGILLKYLFDDNLLPFAVDSLLSLDIFEELAVLEDIILLSNVRVLKLQLLMIFVLTFGVLIIEFNEVILFERLF
jgi:hypothetical protein